MSYILGLSGDLLRLVSVVVRRPFFDFSFKTTEPILTKFGVACVKNAYILKFTSRIPLGERILVKTLKN